ncbi:MAG: PDZ domain-containing protein [Candidatus Omnitrophica bacterium]|nr:PDZ domain-containing protein [Candidatus Omnitrophota bacterium]
MDLFFFFTVVAVFLTPFTSHLTPAVAGEPPSLFRGVVIADGPFGIRVVSVEGSSQAALSDLRPEDVIVEVNAVSLRTIDEFAVVSQSLKGKASQARVLVLRNGQPHELLVHLYSVPILQRWGLSFVYEADVRFAEPKAGLEYWSRLGRGFESVGDDERALNAYLNALHNVPDDLRLALTVDTLLWKLARARLKDDRLAESFGTIQQAATLLERLFDQPLEDAELATVKQELTLTLASLREHRH